MTLTAPIFEIQRFSLHDGPGIRSLVFLKGCALHCPWCQNPESQEVRPVVAFYSERCDETFECEKACPSDAIRREGFRVDAARCMVCGRCVDACPQEALKLIGQLHTPEQLMEKLLVDLPYYESSGGGVTFSGGEPTLHPQFLQRVLTLCGEHSIHTNLETAGVFSWEKWESTLRMLDLIYFDLKLLDSSLHESHLGPGHATIMKNAAMLAEHGFPVEFRMPLVPGYTDTPENVAAAIALLESLGKSTIHLLAYHNMGETKIDIIEGKQPKLGLERYSEERFDEMVALFEARGVEVVNQH